MSSQFIGGALKLKGLKVGAPAGMAPQVRNVPKQDQSKKIKKSKKDEKKHKKHHSKKHKKDKKKKEKHSKHRHESSSSD